MKRIFLKFLMLPAIFLSISPVAFSKSTSRKTTAHHHRQPADPVSIESFGAVAGNPDIDNSVFIQKAIMASDNILIPADKVYYINHAIKINHVNNKSVVADGATIINQNYDEGSFIFAFSDGVKIHGGYYTRPILPQKQNGKSYTFTFTVCKNIIVTKTHINRSPEMGINLNVVINGEFSYNRIEHCLRDGIYAHYSANLKYIGNILSEIKDDALSMHDYGIDAQRTALHAAGYSQGGHSEISGNTITDAMEGVASIGCTDVAITNNTIKNTVNCGINIFNDEKLSRGTDARVNNITISGNSLDRCETDVVINGLPQKNNAQTGGGRAAIFLGDVPSGNGIDFTKSSLRLANIIVKNNIISNGGVNGITGYNVDNLTISDNKFTNCHSDQKNAPQYSGSIVEIINCTHVNIKDNSVVDDRSQVLHDYSYSFKNSDGIFQKGEDKGWRKSEVSSVGSSLRSL